jgi:hypothetical protein
LHQADYKKNITFGTLITVGIFLMLSGWQPAAYSYNSSYPYAILGVPMAFLGLAMVLCSAAQGIFRRQANLIVGLCGQILLGIVAFVIPFLQPLPQSPFNFHTYSIILGGLGIALSIESIAIFAKK